MKLLFAHDHKLRKFNGEYYTLGGLGDSVTNRYTDFFGNMTIVCREIPKQKYDNQLFKICNKKVNIVPISSSSLILNSESRRIIKKQVMESDIIIARLPSVIGKKAIYYAKKYNKKYAIEVVGCAWDGLWNHSFKGKVIAPYMYCSTKKYIKHAPYALYVTDRFLQKRYPCTGKTVCCSDVNLQDNSNENLEKRKQKIENNNNKLILGTLGAIDVGYKGQEYVIKALASLTEVKYEFEYHVVGGGKCDYLLKLCKKLGVEEKVKFLGTLSHEKVFEWLDDVDIYVQPSITEGLPRSVIEAMSKGCLVIGSNAGGIPELISQKYIFEKKNVEQLSRILMDIKKEDFLEARTQNFYKSKEFNEGNLNRKRAEFFSEIAK